MIKVVLFAFATIIALWELSQGERTPRWDVLILSFAVLILCTWNHLP